jgi:hypothetical protein
MPEASFGTAVCGLENTVFRVPAAASASVAALSVVPPLDELVQMPLAGTYV